MQHRLKHQFPRGGVVTPLGRALGCGAQAEAVGTAGSAASSDAAPGRDAGADTSVNADAGAVADVIPCEGVVRITGAGPTKRTGQLHVQLVASAASGTRYRLQNASFILLNVGSGAEPITLESDAAPGADVLESSARWRVRGLAGGWLVARAARR